MALWLGIYAVPVPGKSKIFNRSLTKFYYTIIARRKVRLLKILIAKG
jgi:hypothetical protein